VNLVPQLSADTLKNSLLLQEQVKLLYGSLPLSLVTNLLLATLMLYVMRSAVNMNIAIAWLLLLFAVVLLRASLYWFYRKHGEKKQQYIWLNYFRLGIFSTAALWGGAAWFLFPDSDVTYQVFLAFVMAGISAGAITSLAADRLSAQAFVLLALLPLVMNFVLESGTMPLVMGFMVMLYLIFLVVSALRLQRNLYENVALRAEASEQHDALQESESRFRFMLETCPTAASVTKIGGHKIIFFNKQYINLINSSAKDVSGLDPQSYYANQADYADVLLSLSKGESLSERLIELNIPAAGKKWALATYLNIQYAGVPAVLGWYHDITEQILMDRMKSEFVSTVSHELRTPLTAISGGLGLVVSGVLGELSPKAKEMLDIVNKNSLRLTYLINDLLDMEKFSNGKWSFEMHKIALRPLIAQALEVNSAYGVERRISLVILNEVPDISIYVDKVRLMQVLSNLLSNAIKYSNENGKVEISAQEHDNIVSLTIKDYGPGIPREFYSRIFERFAQADSSDTRKRGGTGLGLAIARELVQQMHGQISFDSVEGEGASFHIKFPVCS
jgi:signal transduction histidine kinase